MQQLACKAELPLVFGKGLFAAFKTESEEQRAHLHDRAIVSVRLSFFFFNVITYLIALTTSVTSVLVHDGRPNH